jgi:hypothetical protein
MKRPLPLTIVGVLFLCVGAGSLARGVARFPGDGDALDLALVAASALLAAGGGAFVLRRRAWARWLCAAWLAAHVALGLAHTGTALAVHAALFVAITFLLFRPGATAWFRGGA